MKKLAVVAGAVVAAVAVHCLVEAYDVPSSQAYIAGEVMGIMATLAGLIL